MSVRTLGPDGVSGVSIVSASGFGPVLVSPAASKSFMGSLGRLFLKRAL
jgi:hypothetical protein